MFKKFALAAAAAAVVATAAPVTAQQSNTQDPFVATQSAGLLTAMGPGALAMIGAFALITVVAASDTD